MDLHRQVNPGVTDEATAISYDPAGNITQVKATLPGGQVDNQCFSYDQLQQLTEWGSWRPKCTCKTTRVISGSMTLVHESSPLARAAS